MQIPNPKYSFEKSLKAIDIENFFDRILYRPIGYKISMLLKDTKITPNIVTIVSIFIGIAAGCLFYKENVWINLLGFFLLMVANTLDCVDGQLARLSGIKSEVGRILDGLAGDIWFIAIYSAIALRLSNHIPPSEAWLLAAFAGISNLIQANIVDYYKTLHLFFISIKKGHEFHSIEEVVAKYKSLKKGINKILGWLYVYYTKLQIFCTPQLQKMLRSLDAKYGKDLPDGVRERLKAESLKIIPIINLATFNWRSVVLLLSIIIQQIWVYLLFEIIVLNITLVVAIVRHENFCKKFEV